MIGNIVTVKVDRPMGSYHPKHKDIYYPINYGYIEGMIAPDFRNSTSTRKSECETAEANFEIALPDEWTEVCGRTEKLSLLYAQIYEDGPVRYEIEEFNDSGDCRIRRYYR